MYPIYELSGDLPSQLEQLGTKAKFWFWGKEGRKVLFKEGRPGTGENWAEKVCCEIARLLSLPHAEYDLAVIDDRKGVISPTFVPDDGRLILGNELLAKNYTDYDERRRYQASQHTLQRVIAALELLSLDYPVGWHRPVEIEAVADVFIGYLVLDALVGNQDRHHENWGVINTPEFGITLAPTFDHASSLGRNESDETRIERLQSKDDGRGLDHYCGRARSGLYKLKLDKKPMKTIFAFQEAVKMSGNAGSYWLSKLRLLELHDFKAIFDQVPDTEITGPAKLFALKMIEINQKRLLSLL